MGYGFAEGGRDYNTTYISEPVLRNVVLKPFKAAKDAGAPKRNHVAILIQLAGGDLAKRK